MNANSLNQHSGQATSGRDCTLLLWQKTPQPFNLKAQPVLFDYLNHRNAAYTALRGSEADSWHVQYIVVVELLTVEWP